MAGRLFWLCVGSVAYTYAGYPLLLTLLARLRGPRLAPATQALPRVTLLIAAYNEAQVIGAKLENSLALDYPPELLQVVVAADGSNDETPAIVADYAVRGVALSYRPERAGKLAAIVRALPLVAGEVVVLSDANNLYDSDALQQLAAVFADPTVGAATGAKVIAKGDGALGESEGLYWNYESYIKRKETVLGSCTGVVGEMLAMRRELLEPAVPAEAALMADDLFLAMRVIRGGHRVVYVPGARSTERVSPSARDELERRGRIVAQRFAMMRMSHRVLPLHNPLVVWQIVSHKYLRPLVPLAMLGALAANLAAVARPARGGGIVRLAAPFNWVMLALQALFYAMAWLSGRVERKGLIGKLLYLPAFLVNGNAAALLGLYRFLSGRHSHTWRRVHRREGMAAATTAGRTPSEQHVASERG